jgi:formate hydrogenlyase subunit 6/NADH:ubiquinone oxidoreductase subunit I
LKTYFQHINEGIRTTLAGMKLTFRHLWAARTRRSNNNIRENDYFNEQTGMVTLQYPFETMPIPDNGRYRLNNEMDDCIVCDKCAKVCPVDCIDIEPIKATSEVGKASDGSPIRLYAAKFDIDMAKCCYCGLCTTVCPTECLTMTKTFDYSEFDVRDMNYHYSNLSPEQAAEKKSLYEQFLKEKEELKKSPQPTVNSSQLAVGGEPPAVSAPTPKPAFKPTIKPSIPKTEEVQSVESKEIAKPKPVFVPKKPTTESQAPTNEQAVTGENSARPKPVFAPKKPASEQSAEEKPIQHEAPVGGTEAKPKPVFKPTKPKTVTDEQPVPVEPSRPEQEETTTIQPEPTAKPKPVFKPTMKPKAVEEKTEEVAKVVDIQPELVARPKPVFKPTMKPKSVEEKTEETDRGTDSHPEPTISKENTDSGEVKPRPKPVFKPIMRPKKEE